MRTPAWLDPLFGEKRGRGPLRARNLHNKVLSSQYKLALPDEKELAEEIAKTRKALLQEHAERNNPPAAPNAPLPYTTSRLLLPSGS